MTIEQRAKFEVALEDLVKEHGLEMVRQPLFDYGPSGIVTTPGSALWTVYDAKGNPTNFLSASFRQINSQASSNTKSHSS